MNLTTALCDRKGENTFPEAGCSPERKACSVLPERVLYFTVQYALAGRNIHYTVKISMKEIGYILI